MDTIDSTRDRGETKSKKGQRMIQLEGAEEDQEADERLKTKDKDPRIRMRIDLFLSPCTCRIEGNCFISFFSLLNPTERMDLFLFPPSPPVSTRLF